MAGAGWSKVQAKNYQGICLDGISAGTINYFLKHGLLAGGIYGRK